MSEVQVVALIQALPDARAEVGDALQELVTASRAEQGCVAYELFVSAADADTYVTVERWDSQADLDAHLAGPVVAQALAAADGKLAAAPAIHPLVPA